MRLVRSFCKRFNPRWGAGWIVLGLSFHRVAADIGLYAIEPDFSVLTLKGNTKSTAWGEQGPESLTASCTGWLAVDLSSGTIQFVVGSTAIIGESNPWQPAPSGSSSEVPASFGGLTLIGKGLNQVRLLTATRNLSFDLTSPPIPFDAGEFATEGLKIAVAKASNPTLDYRTNGLLITSGRRPLGGLKATNAPGAGTLFAAFEVQTLTVPVDFTLTSRIDAPGDTTLRFVGQLVASRSLNFLRPQLLWTRLEANPPQFTLVWASNYKLQNSKTLNPPNWVDVPGDPPMNIQAFDLTGFFRVSP